MTLKLISLAHKFILKSVLQKNVFVGCKALYLCLQYYWILFCIQAKLYFHWIKPQYAMVTRCYDTSYGEL